MSSNEDQLLDEPKKIWQTPTIELFKYHKIEFGQGQCLDDPEVNFGS